MKWLVCGGPEQDVESCSEALTELAAIGLPSIVIHGGEQGAESASGVWAHKLGIHVAEVREVQGIQSRNGAMLLLQPDLVVALSGFGAHMIEAALEAGTPVVKYEEGRWEGYIPQDLFFNDHWETVFDEAGIPTRTHS